MADSNFAQFASTGNPWVTEKTWDRELRDAGNPRCATGRRQAAIEFTAAPPKSHNMRISLPPQNPGHVRKGVTDTARILNARRRMHEMHNPVEIVERKPVTQAVIEPEPASVREARQRRSTKIAYYAMFVNPKRINMKLLAPIVFKNYSEIVELFGSVESYLKGEYK